MEIIRDLNKEYLRTLYDTISEKVIDVKIIPLIFNSSTAFIICSKEDLEESKLDMISSILGDNWKLGLTWVQKDFVYSKCYNFEIVKDNLNSDIRSYNLKNLL